jgi:hypothetical protein
MYIFSNFWSSIPLIRIGYQPKMMEPDPYKINKDPEHCFFDPRIRIRDGKNPDPE